MKTYSGGSGSLGACILGRPLLPLIGEFLDRGEDGDASEG